MPVDTIAWKQGACRIIDQTRLPKNLKYLRIRTAGEMWQAIRLLRIRGAPAIGIAAAYGLYLGIQSSKPGDYPSFKRVLERTARYLRSSRPTAINLSWALDRIIRVAEENRILPIRHLKNRLLEEAHLMLEEDLLAGRALGDAGQRLVPDGAGILTHCNAGGLATAGYGTALAVLYRAKEAGKTISVYACETRPLLQGARLTSWELARNNIPVTLLCDNMAGYLMALGKIDLAIVGADRITRSGDFANKIGTYSLAVLAHAHKIPFYVAAPLSSFDITLKTGAEIPIEQRPSEEITRIGARLLAPRRGVRVFNPAFDVTPHNYVTAFITEQGVINPPFEKNIHRLF